MAGVCGECTLCCKLLEVPELGKGVNTLCGSCVVGIGCKIYDARPTSCKQFKCMWLDTHGPDSLRPDRCHVVFEHVVGVDHIVFALVDSEYEVDVTSGVVFNFIETLVAKGYAVISSNPRMLFLPSGRNADDVMACIYSLSAARRNKE